MSAEEPQISADVPDEEEDAEAFAEASTELGDEGEPTEEYDTEDEAAEEVRCEG